MNRAPGESRSDHLKRTDRTLIKVFAILLAVSFAIILVISLTSEEEDSFYGIALTMLNFTFITIGIMSWVTRGDYGIVPTDKIFKWATIGAVVVGAIAAIYCYFFFNEPISIGIPGFSIELNPYMDLTSTLILFAGLSFGVWGGALGYTSIGFGVIWITVLITRSLLPHILNMIARFKGKNDPYSARIVVWFMDIPDVLEMTELKISEPLERRYFPKRMFIQAVGWELFIGTVLAVYVSLNPVVLESLSLLDAVNILSTLSIIIPLVVIPWFVLTSVNARIPGVKKDFMLFNGIKSRILQTFVALGTIALFVRLALREYEAGTLLNSFVGYYVTLSLLAILFTYIFFNYFDSELAKNIKERYENLRGTASVEGDN
jgi:hypothetical protein